jgi:hypothetical protein
LKSGPEGIWLVIYIEKLTRHNAMNHTHRHLAVLVVAAPHNSPLKHNILVRIRVVSGRNQKKIPKVIYKFLHKSLDQNTTPESSNAKFNVQVSHKKRWLVVVVVFTRNQKINTDKIINGNVYEKYSIHNIKKQWKQLFLPSFRHGGEWMEPASSCWLNFTISGLHHTI